MKKPEKLFKIISLRLTQKEADDLQTVANHHDVSKSWVLRDCLRDAIDKDKSVQAWAEEMMDKNITPIFALGSNTHLLVDIPRPTARILERQARFYGKTPNEYLCEILTKESEKPMIKINKCVSGGSTRKEEQ